MHGYNDLVITRFIIAFIYSVTRRDERKLDDAEESAQCRPSHLHPCIATELGMEFPENLINGM